MKITSIVVTSSITKSHNYQSYTSSLGVEATISDGDDVKALQQQIYDKLTEKCVNNVDKTIADAKKKVAEQTNDKN